MAYYLYRMLEHLGPEWTERLGFLNVFQYLSVRTIGGAGTAFLLVLFFGPYTIRTLIRLKIGQFVRSDEVLADYHKKAGTPTMGGVLIIASVVISTLLWAVPTNLYVWLTLLTMIFYGCIGFYDDYLKLKGRSADGLSSRGKLILQSIWAVIVFSILYSNPGTQVHVTQLMVPFLKDPLIAMPVALAFIFILLVLVGSSNAVNLTDGMDGLAIGCSNAAALAYLVMAYVAGNVIYSNYLYVPYIANVGELSVFCGCLMGAGLGFLWYNCHPARVFMGDTGSLSIGASIGIVAILIKQELVLVIVGGVFVMEALSVVIQVSYFKFSRKRFGEGRRIFRCSPIHHHFQMVAKENAEKEGRDPKATETMVVVRMWILAILFAIVGVATLKIR